MGTSLATAAGGPPHTQALNRSPSHAGNDRPRLFGDAAAHADDFRHHRYRNLGRGAAADAQSDRAVQARDLAGREVEQRQPLAPLVSVGARAERTDIEGRRLQCFQQSHVVQLWIMRQRDDGGTGVGFDRQHRVVGHDGQQLGLLHRPGPVKLFARVADDHMKAEGLGNLRRQGRGLRRADQEQAPARSEHRLEAVLVEPAGFVAGGQRDAAGPGVHIHPPQHQLVPLDMGQYRVDPAGLLQRLNQRLHHQAQCAAARQAEAGRLVLADAVHDGADVRLHAVAPDAFDQVVLDATAGHGAGHQAVIAHAHHGADRARGRAPGRRHRHQHDRMPGLQPGAGRGQRVVVLRVHRRLAISCR